LDGHRPARSEAAHGGREGEAALASAMGCSAGVDSWLFPGAGTAAVRKTTPLFEPFVHKNDHFPRQARDKHRESTSFLKVPFSQATS
jgi:hypothetical protein